LGILKPIVRKMGQSKPIWEAPNLGLMEIGKKLGRTLFQEPPEVNIKNISSQPKPPKKEIKKEL